MKLKQSEEGIHSKASIQGFGEVKSVIMGPGGHH